MVVDEGGSPTRSTYERHAVVEAITLTHSHTAAILWDLKAFFDSIKTYIAIVRLRFRGWSPSIILMAMWGHRAPRIVIYANAASRIYHHIPNSLVAGCTSST